MHNNTSYYMYKERLKTRIIAKRLVPVTHKMVPLSSIQAKLWSLLLAMVCAWPRLSASQCNTAVFRRAG